METEIHAAGRDGDRSVPGKVRRARTAHGRTPRLPSDEVRRNPIFYELDLHPEQGDENLIIDVIYDNLSPMRLQDLYRGTDIPRGVRFWPDWFDIPPYEEMHDIDGRRVYPAGPGYPHGPDPDGPAQVCADGPGPGFQPGEWRVHQPGL